MSARPRFVFIWTVTAVIALIAFFVLATAFVEILR